MYNFLFAAFRWLFRLMFRVTVTPVKNDFNYPRLILTPNHVSFIDGMLLVLFLPIKPVFAVYSNITDSWFMRWLKPYVDFMPLESDQTDGDQASDPRSGKRTSGDCLPGRPYHGDRFTDEDL